MGKARDEIYAPLELLKRISASYPKAWEQMEAFHNMNGSNGLPPWPDWCYAPMSAAIAVATSGGIITNKENLTPFMADAQAIDALAVWRRSKEVFVLDSDMEQLLYEQADDLEIDSNILMRLPYPCFYVQTSSLQMGKQIAKGFFVHLEYDVNDGHAELRLLFLFDDKTTAGFPIYIDESNIRDSLTRTLNEAHNNLTPGSPLHNFLLFHSDEYLELAAFLKKSLQLVLYVCAENAEIKKNPEQDTIMKRSSAGIKDRYAEIRKWDVGVRIGQTIRRYKKVHESIEKDEQRSLIRYSPRPHLRRGHWHHYWTGPKDGERKLILKWTAPTFIGAADDEKPVVIHHILDD